jgi:hypothetical protein
MEIIFIWKKEIIMLQIKLNLKQIHYYKIIIKFKMTLFLNYYMNLNNNTLIILNKHPLEEVKLKYLVNGLKNNFLNIKLTLN